MLIVNSHQKYVNSAILGFRKALLTHFGYNIFLSKQAFFIFFVGKNVHVSQKSQKANE